jgi:hypothetical protein
MEGSAEVGLAVVLIQAGVERRFDMSTPEAISSSRAWNDLAREWINRAEKAGELSPSEAQNCRDVCDRYGALSDQCEQILRSYAEARKAATEAERERLQREARDLERSGNGGGGYGGAGMGRRGRDIFID